MAQGELVERMLGAATLNIQTYEEVEADETATGQAAVVVLMVAVASGIGGASAGMMTIGFTTILQFVSWLLWAGITYLIGDKLLGGTATWGELLRTLGFAQAPGVLYLFGVLPFVGGVIRGVVGIWILVTGIIAIRQALDFGTGKAILTAVLGWIVIMIPFFLLGGMLALLAA